MTYAQCGLKLSTVRKYNNGSLRVWPLSLNMFEHLFHLTNLNLSIKPCQDMTSFCNNLLFITKTHEECGLKLCTVTINSNYSLRVWPLSFTMFGHVHSRQVKIKLEMFEQEDSKKEGYCQSQSCFVPRALQVNLLEQLVMI